MKQMELYVHIPFCVQKCLYCDFLSAPAEYEVKRAYMHRLSEEIETLSPEYDNYEVTTVYIGGGTPSSLEAVQIEQLMEDLFHSYHIREDAEITIECNPGTIYVGNARAMRRAGINRLSFGLQSVRDGELKLLGRIHTFEEFLKSFEEARKAGFSNINIDLMYALPGQSVEDWKDSVKKVVLLRPEHLSVYSLTIEKGTPFYDRYHEDERIREEGGDPELLPSEEEDREMYLVARSYLEDHGYQCYEMSNFAKPGYACRHNIGYWVGEDYLGLGLGASSLIGDVRFSNTSDMQEYLKQPFSRRNEELRSRNAKIGEYMFLGLRMTEGISRQDFKDRFGTEPEAIYGNTLYDLMQEGLLEALEGRIYLTSRGLDVSNQVFSRLLL